MKNFKKLLIILVAVTFVMPACKKGVDDPFLSLKSRKSRVVGEWKLISEKSTSTSSTTMGGTTTNSTDVYTSTGSTYSYSQTDNSGTTTSVGTNTLTITFMKDGTYEMASTVDASTSSETGTWNFTSGVGELKNKSQITLSSLTHTSTGSSSTYTGTYVDVCFDLKKLKSKSMIWYVKTTNSYTSSGYSSSDTYEDEIEFELK